MSKNSRSRRTRTERKPTVTKISEYTTQNTPVVRKLTKRERKKLWHVGLPKDLTFEQLKTVKNNLIKEINQKTKEDKTFADLLDGDDEPIHTEELIDLREKLDVVTELLNKGGKTKKRKRKRTSKKHKKSRKSRKSRKVNKKK